MRLLASTTGFKRDLRLMERRSKSLAKIRTIIEALQHDLPLPARARPHRLTGNYSGTWECHVEPDWLLVYQYDDTQLLLVATGTHSELFD